MKHGVGKHQRHQRWGSGGHLMAKTSRQLIAESIAARLGDGPAAGCENQPIRNESPMSMKHPESRFFARGSFDRVDTVVRSNLHTQLAATLDERVENGSSLVSYRKQFAGLFAFEIDPERGQPCNRLLNGKRGQHILDDPAIAEEIGWGHDLVRDIATPAAGHENFGADGMCAVQQENPNGVGGFCSFCCCDSDGESCRSRSDNDDAARRWFMDIRHF